MAKITGLSSLNPWMAKSKAEKKRLKTRAQAYVRAKVTQVVKEVAKVSPQFTGNYVANWQLTTPQYHTGGYDPIYKWDDWHQVPRRLRKAQNAAPATVTMLQSNFAKIATLRYNSRIELWNHAPVADMIEAQAVSFRNPQNTQYQLHGGGLIPHLTNKFSYLRAKS